MKVRTIVYIIIRNLLITFFVVIGGFVMYDVYLHGSFNKTTASKILNESGTTVFAQKTYNVTKEGVFCAYEYVGKNGPIVVEKVRDISTPYLMLAKDFSLVTYNAMVNAKDAIVEKYPSLGQINTIGHPRDIFNNVISSINGTVNYFVNDVFVNEWSPENMQQFFLSALNTTQSKAIEYFNWMCEKIQTTVK